MYLLLLYYSLYSLFECIFYKLISLIALKTLTEWALVAQNLHVTIEDYYHAGQPAVDVIKLFGAIHLQVALWATLISYSFSEHIFPKIITLLACIKLITFHNFKKILSKTFPWCVLIASHLIVYLLYYNVMEIKRF